MRGVQRSRDEASFASRFRFLKRDLQAAIDHIQPVPGSVLIIRPKDARSKFTSEYVEWLSEHLGEALPPGVRGMILMDDSTEFIRLEPPDHSASEVGDSWVEGYEEGWHAAFDALEAQYNRLAEE